MSRDHNLSPRRAGRKRVLMIAFHFPPEGGSGTQRSLKFARYLPEFGWDVDVLTATTGAYELQDSSLLKEIPSEVMVHRSACVDCRRIGAAGWYPSWLEFPDRYGSWLPFAVARGLGLLRTRSIDVIYSTSPVRTAHLIGLILARRSLLPWVCDFRDPWGGNTHGLKHRANRALERKVMARSSHVIANTTQLEANLIERFPVLRGRLTVLPNGYDDADFAGSSPATSKYPAGFTILHIGETYPGIRDPMPLFEALARLVDRGVVKDGDLVFRFVGTSPSLSTPEFSAWRAARGLDRSIYVEPQVAHIECISELLGTDALLLLQCSPQSNQQVPAKLYEYLRSGRPVLVMTPKGSATGQLALAEGLEWVVDPNDSAQLEEALASIAKIAKLGVRPPSRERGGRFERRYLTGQLARILTSVSEGSSLENC